MIARDFLSPAATAGADSTAGRGDVSDADAACFQTLRPRLFGIAHRVLGSATDADDVVQDTWIRWQGTDRSKVRDAPAFLATTTTRLAINVGQSAYRRRETFIAPEIFEAVDAGAGAGADPSLSTEHNEALRLAVRVLLEKLSPTERAVYLLREAFDYSYRQIAEALELTEANARQISVRARRRLSGRHRRPVGVAEQQRLLDAVVAASRTGSLARLEELLTADEGNHLAATDLHAARGPATGEACVDLAA
jgi:RNA polymerase sigma factor (sigma-70 family)